MGFAGFNPEGARYRTDLTPPQLADNNWNVPYLGRRSFALSETEACMYGYHKLLDAGQDKDAALELIRAEIAFSRAVSIADFGTDADPYGAYTDAWQAMLAESQPDHDEQATPDLAAAGGAATDTGTFEIAGYDFSWLGEPVDIPQTEIDAAYARFLAERDKRFPEVENP